MRILYKTLWFLIRTYTVVFCRLKITGSENIPKEGGMILASNHISAVDPPFLGSSVGRPLYYMAKKELFSNYILGYFIKNLNAFPVDRGIFDKSALGRSRELLSEGFGLIMFPEGTRSKTGELGRGKPGIGMLARLALVPIVPTYIRNSKGFYKVIFTGRRLVVSFGEPISKEWIESVSDDKEGYRAIAGEVMRRIAVLKEKIEKNGYS